ncbi:MAG: LamB/YcsF family protein [Xanthomonadales bacterium]|nr:LamB/YcsF family protein [Xanthomonadales bacterium]MCE7930895.1 LamB/YcsF family protein [Xanthomonadales bacterium PRO6]
MRENCDLNADMGESYGPWRMGEDAALLDVVSSCNLACGFHAGDPLTLLQTIEHARARGVAIGAHPGLPDLAGFGRREMQVSPAELRALARYQVAAVQGCVGAAGARLRHAKAHGALYHMLARDAALAGAFLDGVLALDASLAIIGPPQGALRELARAKGARYLVEGFADRGYQADGSLLPRSRPGALLDAQAGLAQGLALARGESIRAGDGSVLALAIDTLCVHGDGAEAVALARALRVALEAEGIAVRAP